MTSIHRPWRVVVLAAFAVNFTVACGGEKTANGTNDAKGVAPAPDATPGNWSTYNRTLAGDRFSPLAEIDRTNVSQLKSICTYALPEVTSLQTGPIVIGGTMYFTTDTISYAMDAGTCTEKWKMVRHSDTPSSLGVNRGFAYHAGRLYRGTSDAHVIALDTTDGHTVWDHTIDAKGPGVTIPMAPIAANGMVYVGNAGGDLVGVIGHVYALDANDGRVAWKFDVVPDSGAARQTWSNAPHVPVSGGAFWTSFTYDSTAGVLYVPSGNPAPDFDIESRAGDNFYTNSVIALDAKSGRMLAYNQIVKRDIHDWDVDSPPTLITTAGGKLLVASANKDGFLTVLDRAKVTIASTAAPDSLLLPVLYHGATTTRKESTTPLSRTKKTRFCPGVQGGSEWNGAAYHPTSNMLYVGAVDWCSNVQLQKSANVPIPKIGAAWFGADENSKNMMDAPDQAKGWLTAYDAESGSMKWRFAAPRPVLAAVTPTAGGLVFSADLGGQLRAFNSDSGTVLWENNTGQATGGGIISYNAGGRQLIAVASGMKSPVWPGAANKSRILVFGLK
ncbi:MAG: PQQ-binding-like beta-propeller repeat protein [Gemmatimonadaceae bacterium]